MACCYVVLPQYAATKEWLSIVLSKLWPYISLTLEAVIIDILPPILNAKKPKWMEGVSLDRWAWAPSHLQTCNTLDLLHP